jgi:hypothetical protein
VAHLVPSHLSQYQHSPPSTPSNTPPTPQTGGSYYWNESTGETTAIGEPRPKTRFRDTSFGGAGDARFQDGWREPPDADSTFFYSGMGFAVGLLAGIGTQYFH